MTTKVREFIRSTLAGEALKRAEYISDCDRFKEVQDRLHEEGLINRAEHDKQIALIEWCIDMNTEAYGDYIEALAELDNIGKT